MPSVSDLESVRELVREKYASGEPVLISVCVRRPRIELDSVKVVIKGVYPHFFRIETPENESFSLQYNDVLMGKIRFL
ncbi:MAG: hypothetical protein IKC32_03250 [Clostridia bacterium]|nr:hypothetical protein [Clostridia bacterium]